MRPFRLALALVAVVAISACGETHRIEPSSHATARPVGSVAPTVFPSPTKSVAPTPTGSGPTASASPTKDAGPAVTASAANTFDPKSLTVKVGDTVTWTAQGFHTVTSGTAAGGADPKGPLKGEGGFVTYSMTFEKAGTYPYFCVPHASLGMEGEIVVA